MTLDNHPAKSLFRTLQPLVLASASPRRQALLHSVGLQFNVVPSGIEENHQLRETPDAIAQRWAQEKALAVARINPQSWVLAADTLVVLEDKILGKPITPAEAEFMLNQLSGRIHDVVTGVCLLHQSKHKGQVQRVRTLVRFKNLTEEEIRAYVHTGEPLDKAGAYGIQGMGAFLVEWIQGSYTNVVGLPLSESLQWLLQQGVIAPAQP
jgi:septum formation protein